MENQESESNKIEEQQEIEDDLEEIELDDEDLKQLEYEEQQIQNEQKKIPQEINLCQGSQNNQVNNQGQISNDSGDEHHNFIQNDKKQFNQENDQEENSLKKFLRQKLILQKKQQQNQKGEQYQVNQEQLKYKEFKRLQWDQKIGIKVQIDEKDFINKIQNEKIEFFALVNSYQYFLIYYQQIYDHFKVQLPQDKNITDIWFEYKGFPIENNIPFGVAIDLIETKQKEKEIQNQNQNQNQNSFCPLNLILHCQQFPDNLLKIQDCINVNEFWQFQLKFTIKQSQIARFGKSQNLQQHNFLKDLTFKEIQLGLQAYQNSDFEQFYQISESKIWNLNSNNNLNQEIRVPVRIYVEGFQGRIQTFIEFKNQNQILLEFLAEQFPTIFLKSFDKKSFMIQEQYKNFKVTNNRLPLPLNTPVYFLLNQLSNFDGFIYLSLSY